MKKIAVVTGASSGMGVEFARQLAREGGLEEIWLVARRQDRLDSLAAELSGVKGVVIPADLAKPEGCQTLIQRLHQENPELRVFVNNAGFGSYGAFEKTDCAWLLEEVDLNVRSLTWLTREALGFMGQGSRLINVASLAAFQPLGNFAVYGATKAYVHHFTLAVAAEAAGRGIKVTSLCPGPVSTEFSKVASQGVRQEVHGGKPADRVVAQCLKDSRRGKWTSILGMDWKLLPLGIRFVSKELLAWATVRFYTRPSPQDAESLKK